MELDCGAVPCGLTSTTADAVGPASEKRKRLLLRGRRQGDGRQAGIRSPIPGSSKVPGFQHHGFLDSGPFAAERLSRGPVRGAGRGSECSRAWCVQGRNLGSEPCQKRDGTSLSWL